MKKTLLIAGIALFFMGCNPNPNKEARLQTLETSQEATLNTLEALESRVQSLETLNQQLTLKVEALEQANPVQE